MRAHTYIGGRARPHARLFQIFLRDEIYGKSLRIQIC